MSKKYGSGLYNRGRYSRMTPAEADALVSASFALVPNANVLFSGSAAVSASAALSADVDMLFGGAASILGLFGAYADPSLAHEHRGEALITGDFSMYAMVSGDFVGVATVTGDFSMFVEEYAGPYWNPEITPQSWVPEAALSDIWVKQPGASSPWSN